MFLHIYSSVYIGTTINKITIIGITLNLKFFNIITYFNILKNIVHFYPDYHNTLFSNNVF